jgi:uncharacterized protein
MRRLFVAAGIVIVVLATGQPTSASSTTVVISQVYGGGGNTGAVYQNDFIELFNLGSGLVDLTGWSVQYTSATGTGNFGSASNLITPLSGVLAPGQYLLVQEASSAAVGAPLPTPDVTDSTPINMSATGGKVALVNTTTPLGCNGGSTPCPPAALATIVDLIGYDGANFFEGAAAAPTLSNTTAALRANVGCTDTDNNGADFTAGAPNPRNRVSPTHDCSVTPPTGVGAATPSSVQPGGSTLLPVADTPGTNPTTTGIGVTSSLASSGGSASQSFFDDGTNGDSAGGDGTFSFSATVAAATTPGGKTLPCTVSDAQARSSATSITLTVEAPLFAIHDIQGAAHRSPLEGQTVSTNGIVTAVRTNGFYTQDPNPDANDATSEGIFVFTSAAPAVFVGDSVKVTGRVTEFRAGGASSGNLTTTELSSPAVTVLSQSNPLPPTTVVGTGGRVPPDTIIEDDATGDVETSGVFDPASDGIDFWESMEGMRVQLDDAVAVGPTNAFGETAVVGDDGANASVRTARGGLLLRPTDGNPERVVADDALVSMPTMDVGDSYPGPMIGVLDYNFGNFFLEVTNAVVAVHNGLTRETTTAAGTNELAVATFNVENLDPTDGASKFNRLAGLIVNNLQSPDLISVEEVQDNNGATDNGTVDASTTLDTLVAAIQAAGGPAYDYRQINPVNDQDGGEPGGNIRQVFLFRTDRGLSFVDRAGGTSTGATTVIDNGGQPELSFSPGRIDPTNPAWNTSRKPLAGEFMFNGHHLFVIANHFNSKGGDQPLFGHSQPPVRSSEVQRHQQAQIENDFIDSILAIDPDASIVSAGDFNDFEFSDTISILKGGVLNDLIDTLPQNERYSYEFEGNAQVLDHILVSGALFSRPFTFDAVHVNAEFADQASDHDPSVAQITLNDPPTVSAGGPYTVEEGASVGVCATGDDPEGGALTYEWDIDHDGTFETPGQCATFDAAPDGAPSKPTIAVRATDPGGLSATDSTTVQITWHFTGLLPPLLNPPAVNTVKPGDIVMVRFSLGGDQGKAILADGYPASAAHTCGSPGPPDAGEPTEPGAKGLSYDSKKDVYSYAWQTSKAWKRTCRTLVVKLADGSYHYGEVRFK